MKTCYACGVGTPIGEFKDGPLCSECALAMKIIDGAVPPADLVNHPPHYTNHPSGVECITVTEHMSFNIGSAMKYLWRAGLKGAQKQDMEKAIWYINREIERLKL